MINGAELDFNEELHEYRIGGKRLPSVTDICSIIGGSFKASDPVVMNAARRGTAVHELCEMYDYGILPDEIPPELAGYLEAYIRFFRDYRAKWLQIEYPLGNMELGYAGTLDRMGFLSRELTVVDLKTTASMDRAIKVKYACQTAAYGRLVKRNIGMIPSQEIIVQLHKDGKYSVYSRADIERRYNFDALVAFDHAKYIWEATNGH